MFSVCLVIVLCYLIFFLDRLLYTKCWPYTQLIGFWWGLLDPIGAIVSTFWHDSPFQQYTIVPERKRGGIHLNSQEIITYPIEKPNHLLSFNRQEPKKQENI